MLRRGFLGGVLLMMDHVAVGAFDQKVGVELPAVSLYNWSMAWERIVSWGTQESGMCCYYVATRKSSIGNEVDKSSFLNRDTWSPTTHQP